MWQWCRRCGHHIFPIFRRWFSIIRKYRDGGMICVAWLIFHMRYYRLSVFILSRMGIPWCPVPRLFIFVWGIITVETEFWCPSPYMSFILRSVLLLIVFIVKGYHPVSTVLRAVVALIWCGLPIIIRFWHAPPKLVHQWLWWWFLLLIHPSDIPSFQCQLPVCLTVIVVLSLLGIPTPLLVVCGLIGFLLHPMTFTWGYHFPGWFHFFLLMCNPSVLASCQKLGRGIGGIVGPRWWYTLMWSACFCGWEGMRRQDIFPNQDVFWRPFDVDGCNHVKYPEEVEAAETWL